MRYVNVIDAVTGQVWAIQAEKLDAIVQFLNVKIEGGNISADEIRAMSEQARASTSARPAPGSIARLQMYGVISQRMNMLSCFSGGTSTENFSRDFDAAVADPNVGAIIIDVDSPGGTIYGVTELAQKIYRARDPNKPIIAVANSLMASAAYWLASAADEVVVTPGGDVGSVGVFMVHTDFSAADADAGIKNTLIKAGKYKAEGNEFEPLADDARDYMQERVDDIYKAFVADLARNRGVKVDVVRRDFGQGRVLGAKAAVRMGMADRVETLDETIVRVQKTIAKNNRASQRSGNALKLHKQTTHSEEG